MLARWVRVPYAVALVPGGLLVEASHVVAVPRLDGAALGLAGFAVVWDGQSQLVVEEGAIGAAISLILPVTAIAFPSSFG